MTVLAFIAVFVVIWIAAWFALTTPFLRRHPRSSVMIPATPEEIWPLLQPAAWSQYLQRRRWTEVKLASAEPLVWIYREHHPGNRVIREILVQYVHEEFRRLDDVLIGRNGRNVPQRQRVTSTWTLAPCKKGTRVEIVRVGPPWRAITFLRSKLWLNELLQAMRAHVVAQTPESAALRVDVRGWLWTPLLLAPLVWHPASDLPGFSYLYITGFFAGAILMREAGHAIAALAFGRKRIVVALSPLTGAATARARGFRSSYEAAMASLAGPAFIALAAVSLAPALVRAAQILHRFDAPTDARIRLGLTLFEKIDLGSAALVLAGMTLAALSLIPIGSSLGSMIVRSVSHDRLTQMSLVLAAFVAAACIMPKANLQDFLPLFVATAPLCACATRLGLGPKESGLAPMSRRNKAIFLAVGISVWSAFVLEKTNCAFLSQDVSRFPAGGERIFHAKAIQVVDAPAKGLSGLSPRRPPNQQILTSS